jgi:cytochrome c peroxidase
LKFRVTIFIFSVLTILVAITESCRKNDSGSGGGNGPAPLEFKVPAGFPQPQPIFQNNPLTKEGFELGRKLFYDGRLSKDGNFPCASCHQQFAAFATFDHDFSHGFNNSFTTRNAPGLFNMAWHKEMHWDGGINHIEVQPLAPLTAPNEMAETVENVIGKLQADGKYKQMFAAAFGDETINSQRMLKALAQFMGFMTSANSKYDKMKRGEVVFNSFEQSGYQLFKTKCATCHPEPMFTDFSFRNTGIPVNATIKDYGRMRITNNKSDSLKFKVPSLRNVELTYPYGHDGRFFSLDQALNHYRTGVVNAPGTDPLVRNGIAMTQQERNDIIYFLYTLTDTSFTKDKRFAMPE